MPSVDDGAEKPGNAIGSSFGQTPGGESSGMWLITEAFRELVALHPTQTGELFPETVVG